MDLSYLRSRAVTSISSICVSLIKICVITIFMPTHPPFPRSFSAYYPFFNWLSPLPTKIWTQFRDKQALFRAAGWRQHHITKNKLKVEPKFPVILPGDHTEVLHVQLSMFSKQSRCLFVGLYQINVYFCFMTLNSKSIHLFSASLYLILISLHINHLCKIPNQCSNKV